jgi:YfiH family protein
MSVEALTDPVLAALPHGFFTRRGGVSEGPFASLNCSLSGRDDAHAVAENRARAAAWLGFGAEALVGLFQVHSAEVVVLEEPWGVGDRPRADAVVTRRRGLVLGIVTADCAPILFADATAGVIGAAHAGWRGALAGIVEATVAAMERLGARRERIAAAIGPAIRQPSYEVDEGLPGALSRGRQRQCALLRGRWAPGACAVRPAWLLRGSARGGGRGGKLGGDRGHARGA